MKRTLILLLLIATVADAHLEHAGRRWIGRPGLARAGSTAFILNTIATTSAFDPSFSKSGTQTVIMTMSDTTYAGMSFSVIPANRGLSGTKQAIFDFAGGKGTVTTVDFNTDSCAGTIPNLSQFTALTYFYCSTNQLTGSIPSLTTNTALTYFYCYINQLTGSIPSLTTNTALTYFSCSTNQLTGSIPSLTTNTALTYFSCHTNQLTGYTASTISLTATDFRAQTNQLPEASINQILADFALNIASRPTTGTLNIGGTGNAAPTGQGLIDKAAIQSRGWTVTTN